MLVPSSCRPIESTRKAMNAVGCCCTVCGSPPSANAPSAPAASAIAQTNSTTRTCRCATGDRTGSVCSASCPSPGRPGTAAGRACTTARVAAAAQHRVAGEVSVGVVHLTQEIEVGEHDRERAPEPLGALELRCEDAGEVASVVELRFRVEPGRELEAGQLERPVDNDERRKHER